MLDSSIFVGLLSLCFLVQPFPCSTIPFLGSHVLTHSAIGVFANAPGKFSLEPDDIDLGEADQQDPFAPLDQLYRMEKVKLPGSIPVTVGCLWCSMIIYVFLS